MCGRCSGPSCGTRAAMKWSDCRALPLCLSLCLAFSSVTTLTVSVSVCRCFSLSLNLPLSPPFPPSISRSQAPKQQDALLDLLLLHREWSNAFDASPPALPAWLKCDGHSDARKALLISGTDTCLAASVVSNAVKRQRADLMTFLTGFVTRFLQKKGCESVRVDMFGSIAAHLDTPASGGEGEGERER